MKTNLKDILKNVTHFTDENAPAILSGLAVVGVVVTGILVHRATIKAQEIIEEELEPEELSKSEVIAKTWTNYIPPVVCGGLTVAAIIASNRMSAARLATLTGVCALSSDKLKKYQTKVKELLGEKDAQKVQDGLAQDEVSKVDTSALGIGNPGPGKMLVMESITGQVFISSVDAIHRAIAEVNQQLYREEQVCLNSYLHELGRPMSRIGENLWWSNEFTTCVKVEFTSCLTEDNVPCLYINYSDLPLQVNF